ncbi:MAG TPA: tryptophan 2,3-dioxygenase family protein [Rhodothermales bacterium]|nr:tryptophan 2,3-dioxygenase family protein [Rhodothermales bacterium]
MQSSDDAWWAFSLDPEARAATPALAPDAPREAPLDYGGYLHLDALLAAQHPVSNVPDERIFVVTHQLFELIFRQMIFDLGVVARTCERLLAEPDEAFPALAFEPVPDERGPTPFWRPALTAAARLRHAGRHVLPPVMQYLGRSDDGDVLFSTLEFGLFRDLLAPSSGFQTAQLRLIQQALGKGPLLHVPVFPTDAFHAHYPGCPAGHVALGDPLILQTGHTRAFPEDQAPAVVAARLDDLAHRVLARLADGDGPAPPAVRRIHADDLTRAAHRFRATLGDAPDADALTARFEADLTRTAETENTRREHLDGARRGAARLHREAPRSCLAFVLDRLVDLDHALHDPHADSFLTVHRKTVRRHVADNSGTGGGGMPYLVTSQRFLLPLFPALVAYLDLDEPEGLPVDEERW